MGGFDCQTSVLKQTDKASCDSRLSATKAFADALKETEGELVAVASSTELRAKEFCAPYDCKPIEGHHNLISMPEIDAS